MKQIATGINKKFLFLMLGLLFSIGINAQSIKVSGTVTDPTGEPLIGASILVQGSSTAGTATDIDGKYTLDVASDGTIVVSYVGYETQTIAVAGRTTIDVVLKENSVVLNEVVAIGYGTVKKSDATGAMAVVMPDEIEAGLATSAQDLLVGASPGVVVTSNGGDPRGGATIRIRGGSSLSANNNPLVVIDGVPMLGMSYAGTDAMTMVSPDNIESMSILKGASATAIYGSRASNGVIIITTKKGKSGKPQVNFTANMHINTARKTLDVMDGNEFRDVVTNKLGTPSAMAQLGDANTDWQDEVLRTTVSHDYSLSVGGTAGILPYRVSASYTGSNGIIKTSKMDRVTAGFNLSPKFFNDMLSVNASAKGAYVKTRDADTGAVGAAVTFNPTLPVHSNIGMLDEAGAKIFNGYTTVTGGNGAPDGNAAKNPVALLDEVNNRSEIWTSNGNLQLDYALHFLPELHLNLNLGYEVSDASTISTTNQNSVQSWLGNYQNGAGTRYEKSELQRNTLLEFYANYRNEFDEFKSFVDATVGYSWQRSDYQGHEATYINTLGYNNSWGGDNQPPSIYQNGVYDLTLNEATAENIGKTYNNVPMYRWGNKLQLVSFFGRLNYTYDDTYLLTFTLRDDGTSRFSKDTRWGLFPALALGWKAINMPFMEGARDIMNDLKLRLEWGITGQQDVNSYFPYLPVYVESQQAAYYPSPDGNGWINPLYPQAYDPDIKWEETTTWNVGVDMAFLSNRITASFDWYLRDTEDLLANIPVAAGSTTTNYMTRNIGTLRNLGIEATIGAKPIVTKDFTWNTSFNVAWNKNTITKLTGNKESDAPIVAANTPSGIGTGLQYHMVDEAASTFRVYQQVYDQNGDPIPGQYVDINGDGVINDDDRINYHSPDPKVTMTWNNTLNYRNWDFGIVLRANIGNYVYNAQRYARTNLTTVDSYGLNNLIRNEFYFNDITVNDALNLSDYWIENASFLRCDNITLGYTFNELLDNALRLRLYGAVQNPFVITKYKGLDPEVYGGIDNNVYPRPITFTLGLVATF